MAYSLGFTSQLGTNIIPARLAVKLNFRFSAYPYLKSSLFNPDSRIIDISVPLGISFR